MKKEMSIILISFRSILNYKSSVLLLMLQASIQIMISVFLWTYIYQSNQINIAGYDFTSMVQYYLGTILTIEILISGSIAIILSMVLWFLISCCVGMLSFWLENIFFVLTVKEIVIQFLSGILLPLSFFSNNFRLFLDVLPFKYLVYEPLQMFSNDTYKLIDYLRIICIQLIWCIIFYIISRFILRKGVEHFSNVGG
mgnify:CR=1 FL=1